MKTRSRLCFAQAAFLLVLTITPAGCSLVKPAVAPELKGKPLPQLSLSDNNYTGKQIDKRFRKPDISRRFAESYTAQEGPMVTKPLVDYLLKKAKEKREDPKELERCLKTVMPEGVRSVAVPCYAEKAKFEGKDAWIIVQNWGMPGERLIHTRTWVIAVKSSQILYASSSK